MVRCVSKYRFCKADVKWYVSCFASAYPLYRVRCFLFVLQRMNFYPWFAYVLSSC